MAIISSTAVISSLSFFNLICAYFLVTKPEVVTSHNMVVLLSSAVNLPTPVASTFSKDTVALLACVLALFGISDLASFSLREEVTAFYWQIQAPLRLSFLFGLTAYSYSYRPGGLFAGREGSLIAGMKQNVGIEGGLGSGLVFSWAFLELIAWFWAFIALRDERRERRVEVKRD